MILASDVLKTVKKLGNKHPKRQRDCIYVTSASQPCCIVGKALVKHGVDPKVFISVDGLNAATDVKELFLDYADDIGLENDLSMDELESLYKVQRAQDEGAPWGEAIKALKR